jgi:hypothetical protein
LFTALSVTTTSTATIAAHQINKPILSTEAYVKEYFRDIPIMIEIAKCESHYRQLDPDGDVHRGSIDPRDIGVMQINEHYQGETALKENYNIYTLEGNTSYARKLYEDQGTKPWDSSKPCWGRYQDMALNK